MLWLLMMFVEAFPQYLNLPPTTIFLFGVVLNEGYKNMITGTTRSQIGENVYLHLMRVWSMRVSDME
jgi:hypothetical protein